MKTAKAEEEVEVEAIVPPETITDPLGEYRSAIGELQSAVEKAQTLRSIEGGIAAQCGRLEADRELALCKASEAQGDEGGLDSQIEIAELTQASTKLEVMRRKLSDVSRRAQEAEEELVGLRASTLSCFGVLQRAYAAWVFESERTKLSEQMTFSPGQLAVDQVVMCLKTVQAAKRLELTAGDALGLLEQAGRLLEAIGNEPRFVVPAFSPPSVAAGGAAASEPEQYFGPFDPLDGSVDIQAEVSKLMAEDPSLTIVTAPAALRKKFPHLFKSREQVLAMNAPLPGLTDGVGTTREPVMIGDTYLG